MNRDQAIKLLKDGPEGIAEWNRRRINGDAIPSLGGADLFEADLSRANLSRADLTDAKLSGANLFRASLFGVVLTRADLSRADLTDAKLTDAKLSQANLSQANLSDANLFDAKLTDANLSQANLSGVVLIRSDLTRCDLTGSDLAWADLTQANLIEADLTQANLLRANLTWANLTWANLAQADLVRVNLTQANLSVANLEHATCGYTSFGNVDLSQTIGLDKINHLAPSTVGVDTLSQSRGKISAAFLRGCGLAPWEVLSVSLYDREMTPPRFADLQCEIFSAWTKGKDMINGCFISYSWKDSRFVEKLRDRLVSEGINVWLDKHDIVAGPIQDQVWRAIQLQHIVLIVLSEHSVKSDWVENELDMARRKEKEEGRAVLCPIALDDAWKSWLTATDNPDRTLWRTLTQKVVMDFSSWKTKAFEEEFGKLVRGLRINYGPKAASGS